MSKNITVSLSDTEYGALELVGKSILDLIER